MENTSLPRCVVPRSYDPTYPPQLIGFSDSGLLAIGCVFYIRHKLKDGNFEARLLTSKSKTAGIRKLSVPRGELMAFQMMAQCAEYIVNNLKLQIGEVYLLSDSQIVLNQLNKPASSFDIFHGSRIDLIQSLIKKLQLQD